MTRRLTDKEGQKSSDKHTKQGAHANGVVYTPKEVVDFMVAFTSRLLKENFGADFGDENVIVEDPFTGDGRYPEKILRFTDETRCKEAVKTLYGNLWANELDPNVEQVAKSNLEETYKDITGEEKEANVTNMDTFNIDPSSNPPREWTPDEIAKHADELKKEKKRKAHYQKKYPLGEGGIKKEN